MSDEDRLRAAVAMVCATGIDWGPGPFTYETDGVLAHIYRGEPEHGHWIITMPLEQLMAIHREVES